MVPRWQSTFDWWAASKTQCELRAQSTISSGEATYKSPSLHW